MMSTGEKILVGGVVVIGVGAAWYFLTRGKRAHAATLPPGAPPPSPGSSSRVKAHWSTTDDVEALAAVIDSEAGRGTTDERLWIGWAVRNRARKRKVSVAKLVCSPHCGPQNERIGGRAVRPVSSRQRPRDETRTLARVILSLPEQGDPTSGATSFIEPALQDRLVAAGHPGYRYVYAQVRERWIAGGQVPIARVGRFEFWR